MAKSEIYTSEDFLSTAKVDILTLKGFGEKTVDKIAAIILETVATHEAKSVEKEEGKTEVSDSEESILEKVNND